MINSILLIPAYNPDAKLLKLLDELHQHGFSDIVVINDGSKEECEYIFQDIRERKNITLIPHAVNLGKGAALKTGLDYICVTYPDAVSVITADADGQHTPEDILRLVEASSASPNTLILGSRQFDKDVPLRSMFGNKLTAFLMRLMLRIKVSDTQTGLRAIPLAFIPELLFIRYNRYEFELEMLLCAKRSGRRISEITIETVYIDNNESSHFNPLRDSFKIYIVLFRYILVSAATALIDYIFFCAVLLSMYAYEKMTPNEKLSDSEEDASEIAAVAVGRIAGGLFQYFMVRKIVFSSKEKVSRTLPKFALLVICSGFVSYFLMTAIERGLGAGRAGIYLAKLVAESIIYLANFLIQRDLIFHRSCPEDPESCEME